MEWEKAKTILIVVFLLLNAGLFVMNIMAAKSYKISPDEISAISGILSGSDISVECDISIENRPRKLLNMSAVDWDYDYIGTVFFPDSQNVTRTNEFGNIIYNSSEGTSVTVKNASAADTVSELIYYEPVGTKTADGYKKLLGKDFEKFELKRVTSNENGETYLYNEMLKNDVVFASSVEVTFLNEGGVNVNVKRYSFVSYVEGGHDIFRIDEALLTFVHYKNEHMNGSVIIENVDLGYDIDAQTFEKNRKAKPFYRIFISGIREPVFIDAIMNTVL